MANELKKDINIINLLINNYSNINEIDDEKGYSHYFYNITPLIYSIKNNNKAIINKMITSGADINNIDEYNLIPLHYSVLFNCDNDIIKIFIDNTININSNHIWLNIKIYNTNINKISELIINKNNINIKNGNNDESFLIFALKLKINNIIDNGADVNIIDYNSGLTPLIFAKNNNNDIDIINKLIVLVQM